MESIYFELDLTPSSVANDFVSQFRERSQGIFGARVLNGWFSRDVQWWGQDSSESTIGFARFLNSVTCDGDRCPLLIADETLIDRPHELKMDDGT